MPHFEATKPAADVNMSVCKTTKLTSMSKDSQAAVFMPADDPDLPKQAQQGPKTSLLNPATAVGGTKEAHVPVAEQFVKLKNASKKKKKKGGMRPAALAETVTRGFQTPVTSGGEESDVSAVSTPRLRPMKKYSPSSGSSPALRASSLTRAISKLKLSNEELYMERTASSSPQPAALNLDEFPLDGGNADQAAPESWSMPIERDFAVDEARPKMFFGAIEGGLRHDSPHRKMTASDFEPLKCLGKGAFGTVVLVKQRSTGRLFAQKQLKKASLTVQRRLVEQTKNERAILESVNRHPFVVKLYYAFQDQSKLYLILEYAQGGELFHHLALERTFTEEVAAFYMAEMVLALDYLHRELGVVYRDLKPENCLLDAEGHLLLTDFGLSKVALEDPQNPDGGESSKCNSILGTIDYMAPEVVQGKPYDNAVDWWSLGALGFDLLTGAPPFSSNNYAKTQQKIIHGKLALPYYLSPDAKDILTRLLRKEPKKRLGGNMPKDLETMKSHRFFRRVDWNSLRDRDMLAPIQPIITDPAAAENFSQDFTDLALSPVDTSHPLAASLKGPTAGQDIERRSRAESAWGAGGSGPGDDTFGGFSYVASRSLIEAGGLSTL